MRKAVLLLLTLVAAGAVAPSQPAPAAPPVLRYHYGDNPRWADPAFDDSAWPLSENGAIPAPPFNSDGYVWVRTRIPVPAGLAGTLAIQACDDTRHVGVLVRVLEIYVDGTAVGQLGGFPNHAAPQIMPRSITFPLHPGLAQSGQTVAVAVREWAPPARLVEPSAHAMAISIDRETVLANAAHADNADALLDSLPMLVPNLLLILLGLALLALLPRIRSRELLLIAIWLITVPMFVGSVVLTQAGLISTSSRFWILIFFFLRIPGFWVVVELIWTVHRIPSRFFRALAHACWIAYLVPELIVNLSDRPAPWIPAFIFASMGALVLFNAVCLGANLWALLLARRNRIIAAAFTLINIPFLLRASGVPINVTVGTITIDSQVVGFFFAGVAITAMLVRQAVAAWVAGRKLRVELDAAREVQQRLVPLALPAVCGCALAAAYIPAAEVGGDFYQVLPQPEGATLIIIGDVSGKGLKAAMTGALVLGALRSLAQENLLPAQILARLNAQLAAASDGGFVTCLCARITPDGSLILANAGQLAPYRNGEEIPLEPGLPLGVVPGTTYSETTIRLAPGDTLTFLSDGVVEAQSSTGELFGFDRTQAISTQSAEAIAAAAQAHGQEDDITVLTLTFAGVETVDA